MAKKKAPEVTWRNQPRVLPSIRRLRLGQNLQEARLAVGYTQQQLADALGITNETVSDYECSRGNPRIMILAQIAIILGTTTSKLLEGVPNEDLLVVRYGRKRPKKGKE